MSLIPPEPLIDRRAEALAVRRLRAARAVVINGPRQSGKTALLGILHRQLGGTYLTLDQATNLRLARTDPTGFVTGFDEPLFIDEVQRGGDPLILAVKLRLDTSPGRGRFVLAGSTRFLTEPRLSESLAGRVRFIDLWPLSQGEIDGQPDGFVDVVLNRPQRLLRKPAPALSRREVFDRVCRGGFPEAVLASSPADRRDFFADYVRTVTSKDVRQLADLAHMASMRDIVRLLAARTGQEVNVTDLGRELGLPTPTLRRYLPLLETIYLHHLVPAWSRNLTAKVVHRPKLHMVDSGLAAHLAGVDPAGLSRPTSTQAGPLLESFVAGEIARQLTWSASEATLYHWRDRNGSEVDLVVQAADETVAGVEVKAAIDVDESDFRGLRTLRSRLGERFSCGVVVHCGDRPRPFGTKLYAVPVSALWAVD
ncbi:MAG: ATP-binding protein [Acidimicrobiia bacterium]